MESIANYQSHEQEGDALVFQTDKHSLKLSKIKDSGVRVQAIRNEEDFDDFSYAVINRETEPIRILVEENDEFIIGTEDFQIRVSKKPLRLSFEKLDNTVINKDEAAFGIAWDGAEVCNYKCIHDGEVFTGMGEKTGPLNKRGRQYVHWNTDEFGYHQDTDPLYTSTPFYFARNDDNWYGIFLDNTSKSTFNFGASNHRFSFFKAERGQLDYYFFHSQEPSEILKQYCQLTGFTPLPPQWSLGFQQCRYSYYPESEILNLAQNFREREIPADVIYFDIHYMDAYKVFTWHPERFAKIRETLAELRDKGFKVVAIVDPGVKVEEDYEVMEDGLKEDVFLKYPDGENYSAEAWPGKIYFPDFTDEKVRKWWASYFESLVNDGVDGFWNDMNEPAVWGKNVPDLVEFSFEGRKVNHKTAHNVYGMQMARATFEGAKAALKGKRPFVLTRAAFSGIQRYAAVWTGDNVSDPNHLFLGSRLISQLGLAGVPFCGNDIGGFIGEASIQLFQRWIALGAFSPFFRAHTMINSRDAEPWSFGEETEEISRNYISLRYRLLPYIYSSVYEQSETAMPLCSALLLSFPDDDKIFDPTYENQFLFGPSILVCPTGPDENLKKVYLPEGNWYDFFSDEEYEGGREYIIECPNDKIPLFVRESSILLLQSQIQSTSEKPEEILETHLYKGRGDSKFTLYEDDGESYEYLEGHYSKRVFEYLSNDDTLNISLKYGDFESHFRKVRLYLHGFKNIKSVRLGENIFKVYSEDYRYINPISNFDPFEDSSDKSKVIKDLHFIEFEIRDSEMGFEII